MMVVFGSPQVEGRALIYKGGVGKKKRSRTHGGARCRVWYVMRVGMRMCKSKLMHAGGRATYAHRAQVQLKKLPARAKHAHLLYALAAMLITSSSGECAQAFQEHYATLQHGPTD